MTGNLAGPPPAILASVEVYDTTANAWSAGPSLGVARLGLGAALAGNGKIYAIGGQTSSGVVATVEELTP
jgi:N-acetylneuraminic acid mutarotase